MYNTEYSKYSSDPWELANNEIAERMVSRGGRMIRSVGDDKWYAIEQDGRHGHFFLCTTTQLNAGYGDHLNRLVAQHREGLGRGLGGSRNDDLPAPHSEPSGAPLMTVRELLRRLSSLPLDCEIELVTTGVRHGTEVYQSLELTQTLLEDSAKGAQRRACVVFKASTGHPLASLREDCPELQRVGEGEVGGASQQEPPPTFQQYYGDTQAGTYTLDTIYNKLDNYKISYLEYLTRTEKLT